MKELCLFTLLVFAELSLVFCAAPVWEYPRAASHTDSVLESETGGSKIYTLYADFVDAGLTYSIVSQDPVSPAFTLGGTNVIYLQLPTDGVDAETATTFTFVFSVTDGIYPAVTSVDFIVTVIDVDETSPTLSPTDYTGSLTDGAAVGTSVFTLNATDPDATASFVYAITAGNTRDIFEVDDTGMVKVKNSANVNSTTTPSYTLTVTATESVSGTVLTATGVVSVTGAAPVWEYPRAASHTDSVLESETGGTKIYTLYAKGGDGSLTYSIVSQTPAIPVFTIAKNGDLLLPTGGVDAETATSFVFVFSVDDGTNPPVNSVHFMVTVVDVDEFTPTLTRTSYSASITDDTLVGYSVLTLLASGADITATPLTYAITGGNTHDTFAIDSRGTVKVKTASLDSSTTPRYTLRITVTDGGSSTVTATVVISVLTKDACATATYENFIKEQDGNKSVSVTTRSITMTLMLSAILGLYLPF